MKQLVLLFSLSLLFGCVKELPEKPADYEKWYTGEEITSTETTIPCDSSLISNYYETEVNLGGYDSYHVSNVSGYESFDTYSVTASHAQTSTKLHIIIPGKPNTIIGRKLFHISEANYASESNAKYFLTTGNFTNIEFKPITNDSLYVDFYNDSIVFSFCDVEMESSSFNNTTMHLTGRIVSEF
ncbi:hypothetical protein DNU06_09470 [Putridiphycobacter roseus]|uniref:Lipoprotein n=1 Tax=Putridiphycobacter roseus TaxID=2219161 RepID=A0A2W1N0E5_9FLAO|nr:hypothetical protein [Putridiphycobacter roseus]PZE16970.1 hypothetical protein DNU06_09470 [Putridiphycobacter roseus]